MAIVYSSNDIKVKVYGSKNNIEIHFNDGTLLYIAKGNHRDPNTIRIGYIVGNKKYHFIISKKYGLRYTHIDYTIGNGEEGRAKYALISEIVPPKQAYDLAGLASALRNVAISLRSRDRPSKYAIHPIADDIKENVNKIVRTLESKLSKMEEGCRNLDEKVIKTLFKPV